MRQIQRFQRQHLERAWGHEWLIGHTEHYTLKVLSYRAGQSGPLQYHMLKDETFHLISGVAIVRYDAGNGRLVQEMMSPGDSFHIPSGAPHQFEAISDCLVVEASTPHFDDRVNVAERYGREPGPHDLPTTWSAEEIAAFERGNASS